MSIPTYSHGLSWKTASTADGAWRVYGFVHRSGSCVTMRRYNWSYTSSKTFFARSFILDVRRNGRPEESTGKDVRSSGVESQARLAVMRRPKGRA